MHFFYYKIIQTEYMVNFTYLMMKRVHFMYFSHSFSKLSKYGLFIGYKQQKSLSKIQKQATETKKTHNNVKCFTKGRKSIPKID